MSVTLAPIELAHIEAAAERIRGAVVETPMALSRTLSAITGADIFNKFENQQFTASFKERGALNKLAQLGDDARRAGVIAVSAGNHAQGVAYHAQRLGIPATIVMPQHTPFVKVSHTRAFGAEVILTGETIAECRPEADRLATERGLTFVHPFDDAAIIAGQGTVALEMLAAVPDLEVLVAPIGGGGLIAGMATAARALKPEIEVVGAEAALYPSTHDSLAGRARDYGGQTVAEGIAVKAPGALTLPVIRDHVADVVVVGEEAIEQAINLYFNVEKTVVEGAGAAALAAVLAVPERFRGRRVGVVISGGNIDSRLMATVIMRGLVNDGRLARIRVATADVPGQLALVAGLIASSGGNIVEVEHQRLMADVALKSADIDITVETRDRAHLDAIIQSLKDAGYDAHELRFLSDA